MLLGGRLGLKPEEKVAKREQVANECKEVESDSCQFPFYVKSHSVPVGSFWSSFEVWAEGRREIYSLFVGSGPLLSYFSFVKVNVNIKS